MDLGSSFKIVVVTLINDDPMVPSPVLGMVTPPATVVFDFFLSIAKVFLVDFLLGEDTLDSEADGNAEGAYYLVYIF